MGRTPNPVLASVGWPDVLIALIAGLPGILAAVTALLVRREVHTSNGKTLAETVEQTHATATDTNAVVKRTLGERASNGLTEPHGPGAHTRSDDD